MNALQRSWDRWNAPFRRLALNLLSLGIVGSLLGGCAGTTPSAAPSGGNAGAQAPSLSKLFQSNGAKVAYVRSDVIAQRLPEYRDVDNTLKTENAQWLADADKMEADVKSKEAEMDELKLILSADRRKELESGLDKARKDLQKYRQDTWYSDNSRYLKRRKELMEPVDARVNDAIYKVSESLGLDMVFDTVAGNVVYSKQGLDITDKVLEELQR